MQIAKWDECKAMDSYGNEYIDLTSGGIFACMFGPSSRVVKEAMERVDFFHCYSSHYGNYWQEKYKEELHELTGKDSFVVYSSGSEAIEAFLRIAWTYTGKSGVWGGLVDPDETGANKPLCDQFHGWTLGSRILAGRIVWPELGVFPELGANRFGTVPQATACMAMEPYHAPSGQFHKEDPTMQRIRQLRKEFPDILFLVDEIQGGFGRTGKLWAHEWYEPRIYPDFITAGKLAGAGFPLSFLAGPKEIMESKVVQENAHLHSTHSWNPLACSVGCAVIEKMRRWDLINWAQGKAKIIVDGLTGIDRRFHAGKGLLAGIEFKSREECEFIVQKTRQNNVFAINTGRKWIKIGPALTIEPSELTEGIKRLRLSIEEGLFEFSRQAPPLRDNGQEPESSQENLPSPGIQGNGTGQIQNAEDEEQIRSGN